MLMKGYPSWSVPTETFRLAGTLGVNTLRTILKEGLRQGRWPRSWATSQVILLPKPGKEPAPPANFREIQLMDNGAKLCTGAYAGKESQHLHFTLMPGNYGFNPQRGTSLALAHLNITTSRLRKLGKQYVIFLGDIMAAFPKTPHDGLLQAVRQYAQAKGVTIGIEIRNNEVMYVIEMGGNAL